MWVIALGVLLAMVLALHKLRIPSIALLIRPLRSKIETSASPLNVRSANGRQPVPYRYPPIEPWLDFDIVSTKSQAYRPFKWGPQYFVTMGIRNMNPSEWIELDNQFERYHRLCQYRVLTRGSKSVGTMPASPGVPSGEHAALELVHELSEYLSRRYPMVYQVTRTAPKDNDYGWYGLGQIKTISILPLDISYDLEEEDPMTVAGLLVQDDLVLMVEGEAGRYFFQAGSVCIPGTWRMEDKIGLPLEEIHLRGNVPQYREKLEMSMARFFTKLSVDKPVIRNNYAFQIVPPMDDPRRQDSLDPNELAWSTVQHGDEDNFDQSTKKPKTGEGEEEPVGNATNTFFRTERQTLRRLPRTGAIVFTIRTYLDPIVELAKEPGIPGRMASAVRSWPEDVQVYKGHQMLKDNVLPYLDECHKAQVQSGLVSDEDRTSRYPF